MAHRVRPGAAPRCATGPSPRSATPARSRATAPPRRTAGRSPARPSPGRTPRPAGSTAGIVLVLVGLDRRFLPLGMLVRHRPSRRISLFCWRIAAGRLAAGHRFTDHFRRTPAGFPEPSRSRPGYAFTPATGRTTLGLRAGRTHPMTVASVDRRSSCSADRPRVRCVSARVLREYERGVLFRLGRLRPIAGPGLVLCCRSSTG